MAKVYVTNRGGHDYSAAKKYGELVYCTEGSIPRYNTSNMYREIFKAMEGSHRDDKILLTSLTTLNSVACGYFAHKHGRLNLLLFRAKTMERALAGGEYLERTILFAQEEQDDERASEKGSKERGSEEHERTTVSRVSQEGDGLGQEAGEEEEEGRGSPPRDR